jgi:putative transposase
MKRARFSEEQIITILKEAEGGAKVTELCRRHGISDATFYTWRSKYGGLEISEMRRLRQLEEENRRLKFRSWPTRRWNIRALKDVLAKNGHGPR